MYFSILVFASLNLLLKIEPRAGVIKLVISVGAEYRKLGAS